MIRSMLQKTRAYRASSPKKTHGPAVVRGVQSKGKAFTGVLAHRATMKGKMGY